MHGEVISRTAKLSDSDLLRRVRLLAGREREATVELVGHLAELDARKLHVAEGYGSLFAYCTAALRLSEHAAYNRIEAARLSRRCPAVLDLLEDGFLNLSTARLLAPHLRPENFESLAALAKGRSKREVEALVARLAPRPDRPSSVRRLPSRGEPGSPPACGDSETGALARASLPSAAPTVPAGADCPPLSVSGVPLVTPAAAASEAGGTLSPLDPATGSAATVAPSSHAASGARGPTPRPLVAQLAPQRYRVQFTIGEAAHEKLRRAQTLLRREIPDGDPGAIFDRALTLLLEDVARKKLAATWKPRLGRPRLGPGTRTRSRHIPAHVKRAVWVRDGGRCAFVSRKGRRCTERVFLEFHHREPHAVGGEANVANISLRCRAHNVYEAELAFGSSTRPGASCDGTSAARPAAHEKIRQLIDENRQPMRKTGNGAQASSRWTVSGEKAGRHTATYSAPSSPGVL